MRRILLLVGLAVSTSSCSFTKILLPYEEQPLCAKGVGKGYCGSLSDVYQQSIKEEAKSGQKFQE